MEEIQGQVLCSMDAAHPLLKELRAMEPEKKTCTICPGNRDLLPGADAPISVDVTYRQQVFQSSQADVIIEGTRQCKGSCLILSPTYFKPLS